MSNFNLDEYESGRALTRNILILSTSVVLIVLGILVYCHYSDQLMLDNGYVWVAVEETDVRRVETVYRWIKRGK